MALGSQCEVTLTCSYKSLTAATGSGGGGGQSSSFGVDVLVSPDGRERLRVGFTDEPIPTAAPGLRMFVDHSKCCSRNNGSAAAGPAGVDPSCNTTQNAPLPAIITEETNVTMRILVDGGLVEVYGMDAVALTAVATPSSGVSPELRTAGVFAEGAAVASACEVHGWKLSLK
jgi:hypothetical protein